MIAVYQQNNFDGRVSVPTDYTMDDIDRFILDAIERGPKARFNPVSKIKVWHEGSVYKVRFMRWNDFYHKMVTCNGWNVVVYEPRAF